MSDGLIPRRYAKALYKLAVENGDSELIYEQLRHLNFRYTAIDELKRVVLNPDIPDAEKGAYILRAAGGIPGSSLDKFLLLVVQNNRAEMLRKITLSYVDIYREQHRIAHVTITTAAPMPEPEIDAIVAVVKHRLEDMTLEIETVVNPDIIGGFTVNINDLVLDASVKTELNNLRLKLHKNTTTR